MLQLCFWICCDLSWLFNEKENHIFKKRTPLPHCFYLQNALSYTMIPAEDIMDLLKLCLASTYFHYNDNHYKQLHGTAMESPVSVVVAEIVMQNIEKRGLYTCRQTIPLWLWFVDEKFTAVQHAEIDALHHHHHNGHNTDIQFNREVEENGKEPFLDCVVSREDNLLRTTVYNEPTQNRLLDELFYNLGDIRHKATTIRTPKRRAQLVCSTWT